MKRKKRVLVIGPSPHQFSGGIAFHIGNIISAFEGNAEIEIFHFENTKANYNRETWSKKIKRNLHNFVPLIRAIQSSGAVHINSTFDSRSVVRDALTAFISTMIFRRKTIFQFHGGDPGNVFFFTNIVFKKVIRHLFHKCDHILVLSTIQEEKISWYFPEIKITRTPNYIENLRDVGSKKTETVVFIYLGRIIQSKGIPVVLDATSILSKSHTNFKVLAFGKGPDSEWFKAQIIKRDLAAWISYRGVVLGDEKDIALKKSNVMLLPTMHNEGFPYSILEAFNYKIPVIGTKMGAIPDIIESGVNGYIINTNDPQSLYLAMREFCDFPEKCIGMGNNAKDKLLARYTHSMMIKNFTTLYS